MPDAPSRRCDWAGEDPLYVSYHDDEWGVPVRDDQTLFEFITLEGAQAGLSWITILKKRDRYREVFASFDPAEVARFTPKRIDALLTDPGIVRNRGKVASTVTNAQSFLTVQDDHGSFAGYLWEWVGGHPIQNGFRTMSEIPAETDVSQALSKDLKRRGFKFVGPTIMYAFMQAVGMVNDHVTSCWRWEELGGT